MNDPCMARIDVAVDMWVRCAVYMCARCAKSELRNDVTAGRVTKQWRGYTRFGAKDTSVVRPGPPGIMISRTVTECKVVHQLSNGRQSNSHETV